MTIGEKIRAQREQSGMTQTELGKACSVTKQTIFKYETGVVTNIPLDKLMLISDALNVSAAYLMGWEDDPTPADNKKDAPAMSESVMQLVKVIEQLSPENQKTLAVVAKGLLRDQSES